MKKRIMRIIVLLFAIFILSILSINVFAACGCASKKVTPQQTATQQVQAAAQPAIQGKAVQEIQPVNISQQTEEKKPDTKTLQKYTGYLYYLFSFLIR